MKTRRITAIILLVVLFTCLLTACGGKGICDYCGKEAKLKAYYNPILEQRVNICADCEKAVKELQKELSGLLN